MIITKIIIIIKLQHWRDNIIFTILMKGILKLFLGPTSCKEIYDKDTLVDLIFGYYLCSTSNIPLSRNYFKPIASPNIP